MTEIERFRPSRRALTAGIAALAAGGLAGPLAGPASAAARQSRAAAQDAPPVVPALQQWAGGEGEFRLTPATRVVVPPGDKRLRRLARTLTDELEEVTGIRIRPPRPAAPHTGGGRPRRGEIRLTVDRSDSHAPGGARYREEGSRTTVTHGGISVVGPAYAGVFHATRSLLQILVRSSRRAVPAGTAVDWPDYARRGFMLDVGRRYFTPGFIRDYIRLMSWFKFNDFQIHLNDNEIKPPEGDWGKAQSAFRLASEAPEWAGLAARDGAYDRATWDSFEDLAEACAVRLTPEIDAPAHSRAFVKFRPDIGLDGGNSDHLDLAKPASTAFMKDLFTHFTPWFRSPVVHYGADEYGGPVAQYRGYFNDLAAHLRTLGKQPAAWGSLSEIGGTAEGYDRGVRIHSWNNGWYGPQAIKRDGYEFVNMNDATLYIVPFADYYHGQGLDGRYLYEQWAPHVFPEGQSVEPYDPALHGALFAVWNDLVHEDYTERDVHGLVNKTLGVLAQKMWSPRAEGPGYDAFQKGVSALGLGPGLELLG
ncbi:family 20 glycosylhydrolase [Streptomyces iconiensis]|uniref:Family 20 glycosylhydrolase n=1 Tax=Streptomyces iconiensis TaxID=1384038 RepID=A0ABT6ZN59_9ACTN|nr:family 20 glycosylhydrolase [Streptomyces iconiensis]MDJ1130504.1 family 20 glycosylhydrolase [Streptomyces iconiensis]